MPKWTLKRLVMVGGKPTLAPLTKDEQDSYKDVLRSAAESQCASPIYSGFHVKGSIHIPGAGHASQSGNIEYGHHQALHLEEAAVAALASRFNTSEHREPPVLAIIAGHGKGGLKNLTMPCGNCRDILRDTVGEHCAIVSGNTDGGVAVVAELADALFDCYRPVPLGKIDVMPDVIHRLMRDGERLAKNPHHAPDKAPLRNYFASIMTGTGDVGAYGPYVGAIQVGADYHPVYPAEVALLRMEFARDPYIRSVIIAAEGDGKYPPDVMYRDRQALLGAAIEHEHLTGKRHDPMVRLFTVKDGAITGAWKTSVEEWLPLPFSSRNFGKESEARHAAYFKKRYGL